MPKMSDSENESKIVESGIAVNKNEENEIEGSEIKVKPGIVEDKEVAEEIVKLDSSEAIGEKPEVNHLTTKENVDKTEANSNHEATEITEIKGVRDEDVVSADSSEARVEEGNLDNGVDGRKTEENANGNQEQKKETVRTKIKEKSDLIVDEEVIQENNVKPRENTKDVAEKRNQTERRDAEVTQIKGKQEQLIGEELIEEIVRADSPEAIVNKTEGNDSNAVGNSKETEENTDKINHESAESNNEESTEVNEASNDFRNVDADGWEDLLGSGRLRKRVIVEGDPKQHARKGSQVKIQFTGSFEGQVFEDTEVEFCVQENEVISALNLVLPLMNLGEKCEIITDPEFAYGKAGFPPILPPNAAIHAVVTLLEVRPGPVITELPLNERKLIGHRKKDRGNFWYARQDYTNAVQCYRRAVEYFDDEKLEFEVPIDRFSLDPELQELLQDRLKTFNNLAQAQMKLDSWEAALASVKNVLKIEPNNEKALYRKAKCLEERGQVEEALGILRRITRLYPDNKTSKNDLTRLTDRRKKNRLAEERMSKRMLGLDVDAKTVDKKFDKTKSGFLSNKQWVTVGVIMGGAGVLLGGLFSWFKVQF